MKSLCDIADDLAHPFSNKLVRGCIEDAFGKIPPEEVSEHKPGCSTAQEDLWVFDPSDKGQLHRFDIGFGTDPSQWDINSPTLELTDARVYSIGSLFDLVESRYRDHPIIKGENTLKKVFVRLRDCVISVTGYDELPTWARLTLERCNINVEIRQSPVRADLDILDDEDMWMFAGSTLTITRCRIESEVHISFDHDSEANEQGQQIHILDSEFSECLIIRGGSTARQQVFLKGNRFNGPVMLRPWSTSLDRNTAVVGCRFRSHSGLFAPGGHLRIAGCVFENPFSTYEIREKFENEHGLTGLCHLSLHNSIIGEGNYGLIVEQISTEGLVHAPGAEHPWLTLKDEFSGPFMFVHYVIAAVFVIRHAATAYGWQILDSIGLAKAGIDGANAGSYRMIEIFLGCHLGPATCVLSVIALLVYGLNIWVSRRVNSFVVRETRSHVTPLWGYHGWRHAIAGYGLPFMLTRVFARKFLWVASFGMAADVLVWAIFTRVTIG